MPRNAIVRNVFVEDAKVVFVLESPHVDEVAHGYPLAGHAGREMSRCIFGRYDVPFGLIARERDLASLLGLELKKPYSVMNISQQPLQADAYIKNELQLPANIGLRIRLRESLARSATLMTKHRDETLNQIKKQMYAQFRSECSKLEADTVVVACGNVARAFCEPLLLESELRAR